LKDYLGSAGVVTDASSNTIGEQRYYPFGETRLTPGILNTDKLFTGQREQAGESCLCQVLTIRYFSPVTIL
jgi:hypothetical protein